MKENPTSQHCKKRAREAQSHGIGDRHKGEASVPTKQPKHSTQHADEVDMGVLEFEASFDRRPTERYHVSRSDSILQKSKLGKGKDRNFSKGEFSSAC